MMKSIKRPHANEIAKLRSQCQNGHEHTFAGVTNGMGISDFAKNMVASGAGLQNGKFVGAFDDGIANIKSLMPEVEEEDDSEEADDLDDAGTSGRPRPLKKINPATTPAHQWR